VWTRHWVASMALTVLLTAALGIPSALNQPTLHAHRLGPTSLVATELDTVSAEQTAEGDPFSEARKNRRGPQPVVISDTTAVVPRQSNTVQVPSAEPAIAVRSSSETTPLSESAVRADADQIGVGAPAPWPLATNGDAMVKDLAASSATAEARSYSGNTDFVDWTLMLKDAPSARAVQHTTPTDAQKTELALTPSFASMMANDTQIFAKHRSTPESCTWAGTMLHLDWTLILNRYPRPTLAPTAAPTAAPTTAAPTAAPTDAPTVAPTIAPTADPTTGAMREIPPFCSDSRMEAFGTLLVSEEGQCNATLESDDCKSWAHTNGKKFRLLPNTMQYDGWPYGCFQHTTAASDVSPVYYNERTNDPVSVSGALRICAQCVGREGPSPRDDAASGEDTGSGEDASGEDTGSGEAVSGTIVVPEIVVPSPAPSPDVLDTPMPSGAPLHAVTEEVASGDIRDILGDVGLPSPEPPAEDNRTVIAKTARMSHSPSGAGAALSHREPGSPQLFPDSQREILQLLQDKRAATRLLSSSATNTHVWAGKGHQFCGVDFTFSMTPQAGRSAPSAITSSVWSGHLDNAHFDLILTPTMTQEEMEEESQEVAEEMEARRKQRAKQAQSEQAQSETMLP